MAEKKDKVVTIPLTITLLNTECSLNNISDYINNYNQENLILAKDNYVIIKRNGRLKYPSWLLDFSNKVLNNYDIESFFNKSIYEGLIIIKEIILKERTYIFVLTFGQGYHDINSKKIDENFGIYVAHKLVIGKNALIYNAQTRNLEGDPINKNRVFSKELEQEALFTLLDNDEVLRELKIYSKNNDADFSSIIGKFKSLKIKFRFKESEIPCFDKIDLRLIKLIELYESISDEEISWLFKGFQPVKYSKEIELNSQLPGKILNSKDNKVYLFEPEIDYDFMRVENIQYKIKDNNKVKLSTKFEKLNFNDYLEIKKKPTLSDLENDYILLIDDEEHICKMWSIFEALYGEFKYGNDIYILSNKKWHKVEKNKYERINNKIKTITNTSFSLPDEVFFKTNKLVSEYKMSKDYINAKNKKVPFEDFFNKSFSEELKYILLDKKLIKIEDTQFEICDVYDQKRNEYYHVKIGTSASMLNHLFSQGYASARAYKTTPEEFVKLVSDIIKKDKNYDDKIIIKEENKDAIINYLIVNPKKVNELSFLCKMSLIEKIENLEAFGFKVRLTWVNGARIINE